MDLLIRDARTSDAAALNAWETVAAAPACRPGPPLARVRAQECITRSPAVHRVGEDEMGRVVGQLYAEFAGKEWRLEGLAVRPWARRCGVGSALLDDFLWGIVGDGESVSLECRPGNLVALRMYRRRGFAPVEVRDARFGPAVEMRRACGCYADGR